MCPLACRDGVVGLGLQCYGVIEAAALIVEDSLDEFMRFQNVRLPRRAAADSSNGRTAWRHRKDFFGD